MLEPETQTRTRRRILIGGLALAATLAVGCGSDDDDGSDAEGVAHEDVAALEVGATRDEVDETLDADPVLSATATEDAGGGCEYYVMADSEPGSVWALCFDDAEELQPVEAQFPPARGPGPPSEASAARAALIALGDTTCQEDYEKLGGITRDVNKALNEFAAESSTGARDGVGEAIQSFIDNISHTHEVLSSFEAPSDAKETLDEYLAGLEEQITTLDGARAAFLEGDIDRYDELGTEFTKIGRDARENAEKYGFSVCSASRFG